MNDVLPFLAPQPRPIGLKIIRINRPGYQATLISRQWQEGDAARCRLCPAGTCCVDPWGNCTLLVPWFVPAEDLALHRRAPAAGAPGAEPRRRSEGGGP